MHNVFIEAGTSRSLSEHDTPDSPHPATRRVQLSQKRACPHFTDVNPWRGDTYRHTSQDSSGAAVDRTLDELDADDIVAVAVVA